jgi:hypothetical protein
LRKEAGKRLMERERIQDADIRSAPGAFVKRKGRRREAADDLYKKTRSGLKQKTTKSGIFNISSGKQRIWRPFGPRYARRLVDRESGV